MRFGTTSGQKEDLQVKNKVNEKEKIMNCVQPWHCPFRVYPLLGLP